MFGDIDLSWSEFSKIFHILTNKMCELKYNKTDHKTHVTKCTVWVTENFQYNFFDHTFLFPTNLGEATWKASRPPLPPNFPTIEKITLSSGLVEALRCKPEGRGFDPRWCHWNFSSTSSFQPHCGPRVDSASNKNEYQEYFLVGKGGRCVGLTILPLSSADCVEIWASQPPGTLKAFPGLYSDCFTFTLSSVKRSIIEAKCFRPLWNESLPQSFNALCACRSCPPFDMNSIWCSCAF